MRERGLVEQIEAGGIFACVSVECCGQSDARMRAAERRHRANRIHWIGDQVLNRHRRIGDAVHERRVRAVLQKAAHQIGQQRFVRPHRRVDAARPVQFVGTDNLVVERFAHAVQALEFVIAGVEVGTWHLEDGRQRLRVVSGELREDRVARREQLSRAGDVGNVGVDFPREDRKIRESVDLRALDLGIPIGALDQPDRDAPLGAAGEIDEKIDDERAAFAIGLHHEADAVPPRQRRVVAKVF